MLLIFFFRGFHDQFYAIFKPIFVITAGWIASIKIPITSLQPFDVFSFKPWSVLFLESEASPAENLKNCRYLFRSTFKLNYAHNYYLLRFISV